MWRFWVPLMLLFVIGSANLNSRRTPEAATTNTETGYGYVSDDHCGCTDDTAKPKHELCARCCVKGGDKCPKEKHHQNSGQGDSSSTPPKYVLCREYRSYVFKDQALADHYAGQRVKITGQFEGDTVTVASIEPAPESAPKVYAKNVKTLTGVVSDSKCGAAKHDAACVKKCVDAGEKYVLVSHGKVYQLNDQDKFADMGGYVVKVTGEVKGDSVTVASVEALMKMKKDSIKM